MVTSPEEQIVLSLARLQPPGPITMNSGKTGVKDSGPVDYDKVLRLASENGVASLLYRNRGAFADLPGNISTRLKTIYLSALQSNVRHTMETLRLVRLLRGGGIEAIPLKGPIASDILFGDVGLYPTSDIDLLVRPSDMEKAEGLLREAGYPKMRETSEKDLLRSHYHLIFHNGAYIVELHWNLVKRYFTVPPDFWWERTLSVLYEGTEITVLSAERYVLYTIFRLYDHGFRPLKFFVLIAGLINKYKGEMDWAGLLSFAEQYRMKRLVIFALRLVQELSGADVPDSVAGTKIFGYNFLKKDIISGLFRGTRVHLSMLLYTSLLDSPFDILRVLSGRIFPGAGEIRLRYGLPEKSKMLYVYYLLNPFLLLLRRR